MRIFGIIILILIALTISIFLISTRNANKNAGGLSQNTIMILTSPSFKNNEYIPKKFTCDGSTSLAAGGGNMNPELQIQNVPENAKSLALIMHDPDAPMLGGFTHWVVWNIAPTTAVIKEESVPPGAIEGQNGRGAGYTGPCPPSGTHRYFFKLYALNTTLSLLSSTTKINLESAMEGHVMAEAELIGLYQR